MPRKISLISVFVILMLFCVSINAAIYQYRDASGNIVFSDKPVSGSKQIKQNQPSVASSPHAHKQEKKVKDLSNPIRGAAKVVEQKKRVAKRYTSISIVSPKDDEGIRSNNGSLTIQVSLKPKLQVKFDHGLKLYFDGKLLKEKWGNQAISLKNLDRGTHKISVMVVDKKGKKLKQSKTSTFHLLRYSILFGR